MRSAAVTAVVILLSIGVATAQPVPTQRGAPATAPSPGTSNPAPAQRGVPPTASAPGTPNQYKSEADAKSHCPTGSVVWMNLGSHVYHTAGTKDYGHTKQGAYMCPSDADKVGRAAKNEKPTKR